MKQDNADFTVSFWGVRGSIPVADPDYLKYGGNTPCVEVRCGQTLLIFDAGTGIKNLGLALAQETDDHNPDINLLISHTHWDHIQGFPFFSPIFRKGQRINIYGGHFLSDIRTLLSGQMDLEYFPVALDDLPADIRYYDLDENPLLIGNAAIYHTHLLHPSLSVGFRVEYGRSVFVYATDNEIISDREMPDFNMENMSRLISDADLVVAEAQYNSEEYVTKVGWGHSTVESITEMCLRFRVKHLCIFHHDPYHPDAVIDRMVRDARRIAGKRMTVTGAREGLKIYIQGPVRG